MVTKLPEQTEFCREIVQAIFPKVSEATRTDIIQLFDHAFNHPWVDDEQRASMVENICRQWSIKVPAEYAECQE